MLSNQMATTHHAREEDRCLQNRRKPKEERFHHQDMLRKQKKVRPEQKTEKRGEAKEREEEMEDASITSFFAICQNETEDIEPNPDKDVVV